MEDKELTEIEKSISEDIQSEIAPIYRKYKHEKKSFIDALEWFIEIVQKHLNYEQLRKEMKKRNPSSDWDWPNNKELEEDREI